MECVRIKKDEAFQLFQISLVLWGPYRLSCLVGIDLLDLPYASHFALRRKGRSSHASKCFERNLSFNSQGKPCIEQCDMGNSFQGELSYPNTLGRLRRCHYSFCRSPCWGNLAPLSLAFDALICDLSWTLSRIFADIADASPAVVSCSIVRRSWCRIRCSPWGQSPDWSTRSRSRLLRRISSFQIPTSHSSGNVAFRRMLLTWRNSSL